MKKVIYYSIVLLCSGRADALLIKLKIKLSLKKLSDTSYLQ